MVVVKVLYFVFLVDCGQFTKGSWPNHLLATCSTYLKGEFICTGHYIHCTCTTSESVLIGNFSCTRPEKF